uniref:Kazal-like domain-containing protein n=1 Tax=Xiphophorus couchianus TaxID=32473 RepID=A0A3B5M803_9TELE
RFLSLFCVIFSLQSFTTFRQQLLMITFFGMKSTTAVRLLCKRFTTPNRRRCNNDYAPVCGSNNKNYQNECFLRRDACKLQSEVLIMSEGDCPAGTRIYITAHTHEHTHSCRGA